MLVKSYQFTGIDFGHLGQLDPNNMKQSGTLNQIAINRDRVLEEDIDSHDEVSLEGNVLATV